MSKDLDYFAEFLADPSKYPFDEFHGWVKQWGQYISDHKDEFNYLEDDEWKEIRERVLDALYDSEDQMDAVKEEWEEISKIGENIEKMGDRESIKYLRRRLKFMKDYKNYCGFKDEDIAELEKHTAELIIHVRAAEAARLNLQMSRVNVSRSVAELDEQLVRYYERTGKIPSIPNFEVKIKKHKGN